MKVNKKIPLLLFALFISFLSQSQNNEKLDSLLKLISFQRDTALANTYNKLFLAKFRRSPEEAKLYLDSAFSSLKGYDNKRLSAKLMLSKGIFFQRTAQMKKAEKVFKEAIEEFDRLNDKMNGSAAYNGLGTVQMEFGQFDNALRSYMNSLKLKEELKVGGLELVKSYGNIGILYKNIGNYDLAIQYLKNAEQIAIENKLTRELAMLRASMGQVYGKRKQYKEALKNKLEALEYYEESKSTRLLAVMYENLGGLYEEMDSLSKAEVYYKKSLDLCEQKNEGLICSLAQIGLGRLNLNFKNYPVALEYLYKALESSKSTGQEEETMNTYKYLAETYAAMGNYKKAYDYDTLHFKKYDTIFKAENIRKINELGIQYQTEKKEQQIAQQETEISLLEEQEKVSNLQKILLGGGMTLSLITLGFGFYGFRQRTKRNQLEKEKVDAELQLKKSELAFKKKELTSHALHLAKKNEVLEGLKQKAAELKKTEGGGKAYQELITTINFDQQDDKVWENFTRYFEAVHKDFEKDAVSRYPDISKNELRLMALIKMNLSSKEIANILNISSDGVKKARQRLRKKMNLEPEDSLETTVMAI